MGIRLLRSGTISRKRWFDHVAVTADGRLRPFGLTAVRASECGASTGASAWAAAALGAFALPSLLAATASLAAACFRAGSGHGRRPRPREPEPAGEAGG